MPRFLNSDPPDWCELRHFAVHSLSLGQTTTVARREKRERLLVTEGRLLLRAGPRALVLRAGQFHDLDHGLNGYAITASTETAEAIAFSGTWGDEVAGCGIWTMINQPDPQDQGDPVPYPKRTRMDSHYHDYDEYWVILDGTATAIVSGQSFEVTKGDCVAIGCGHHHDMPEVARPMRGAFFETTLLGKKRLGHLWEHTHGPASPDPGKR